MRHANAASHTRRSRWGAGVWLWACVFLLGGCTQATRGTIDTIKLEWQSHAKLNPTPEQVAANPYAQIHVTTNGGDAILVLGNIDGHRQYWYGKDGAFVVLDHGRVVQTFGLPENLDASRIVSTNDPFDAGLNHVDSHAAYDRQDDWSPGYRYGIPVHAELSASGNATIDILGTSHAVTLITEDMAMPAAGFHATNRYWVDPQDGFVWKSEQHLMPGLTLTVVQLRPYRGSP